MDNKTTQNTQDIMKQVKQHYDMHYTHNITKQHN